MEPLDLYADLAQRLSRRQFEERFRGLFLLKRPALGAAPGGPITFRTQALSINDQGLLSDSAPFSDGFWVWPVTKKPENPFPERISFGRATNCDVVFRLSYVSKLHAHLVSEGDTLTLTDQGSANGTEVNGEPLKANSPVKVKPGDRVKFGRLELKLLDAGAFYDTLVNDVIPTL